MEWLVSLWHAASAGAEDHRLGRWLFLRALGGVYLVAFLSLWPQVRGLLGRDGILPVRDFLDGLRRSDRGARVLSVPTIFWWRDDDRFLQGVCGAGVALSLLVVLGVAPAVCLLALWILYLSFTAVGQDFLSYQWDILLLEAGFLGIFLAPWRWLSGPLGSGGPVPAVPLVLLWWLLFRLVFQSGVGKLTSGDASWRDLSAVRYHWWTQPLPAWTAWYVDKLPGRLHRAATAATLVLEILFPVLLFGTREMRIVAFGGIVLLQLLIMATGNYNFFNVLTVALAVLLLDDAAWATLLSAGLVGEIVDPARVAVGGDVRRALTLALAAVVGVVSLPRLWRTCFPDRPLPTAFRRIILRVEPFRTINSYGLFRVMTRRRPEIIVQGSRDGENWREYEFRWKPGDPTVRPRFCQPHQPRLDWQMWFAALGTMQQNHWFRRFLGRLLEGSPAVEALLRDVPFDDGPPRYVKAELYEYRFTSVEERRETGRWWRRDRVGLYAPPSTLQARSSS